MSNMFITIKLLAAAMMARLNEHFEIKSEKGVTIIEYALLAALIAVALVTAMTTLKNNIANPFTNIATAF
jgi:pilus assembly protein Flp/PilA